MSALSLDLPHKRDELRILSDRSCVDICNTDHHPVGMKTGQPIAEVNIHLRARAQDRMLIDQAAELLGSNRSQFMMASAIKEAKNVLLDQTTFYVDSKTFQKVLDWLDAPATPEQAAGMKRLLASKAPWSRD
jgi:uncharacterized protein (DUF1778 family)